MRVLKPNAFVTLNCCLCSHQTLINFFMCLFQSIHKSNSTLMRDIQHRTTMGRSTLPDLELTATRRLHVPCLTRINPRFPDGKKYNCVTFPHWKGVVRLFPTYST